MSCRRADGRRRDQHLSLTLPSRVRGACGRGGRGSRGAPRGAGRRGAVRGADPAARWVRTVRRRADCDGALTIFVGVDGAAAGAFLLEDPIRTDANRTIRELRRAGISHIEMVTGDRPTLRGPSVRSWALMRFEPSSRRRTRSIRSASPACVRRRSWSVTASTTRRHWRPPTWVWPWEREAQPRHPRQRTSSSRSIVSTAWLRRCASHDGPVALPVKA